MNKIVLMKILTENRRKVKGKGKREKGEEGENKRQEIKKDGSRKRRRE
jgi:hypothetical protein